MWLYGISHCIDKQIEFMWLYFTFSVILSNWQIKDSLLFPLSDIMLCFYAMHFILSIVSLHLGISIMHRIGAIANATSLVFRTLISYNDVSTYKTCNDDFAL